MGYLPCKIKREKSETIINNEGEQCSPSLFIDDAVVCFVASVVLSTQPAAGVALLPTEP